MNEQERRESLEALSHNLESAQPTQEHHRDLLDRLRLEVSEALDPDYDNDYDSLRERLEESFVEFEAENPRLGSALRQAINVLSQGGV